MSSLPVDPAERLQSLIAAFDGPITRPKISLPYRAGLAAVAVAMLVLPILYLGLAIAAGWAVLTLDAAMINSGVTGRPLVFGLAAVTVGGGCAVLFMFKPLFAPRPRAPELHSLRREDEPVLFGFVDHLCGVVGAARPASIDVACQVNAFASFRRGALSLLGPDLKLTIGLPLVAGLTLRQFTGVLAHEFGHFSQGTGMRLTYVIRSVNAWFARVVYERDAWDEALVRRSSRGNVYVVGIAHVARGAVWVARRVLWALMMCGHALSCFALRQMEYDADAYETQISGSDVFESTSLRITQLAVASQAAHGQLAETWKERRLVEDLPGFIAARLSTFEPSTLQAIHEQALARKTGSLDTHPADVDRIAAARRVHAPGVFDVEAPADVLFARFDALSIDVTRRYYANMIGPALGEAKLQSVRQLTAAGLADAEAGQALTHVFGPGLPAICLASLDALHVAPVDRDEAVATLRELIREMHATAARAGAAMTRFDKVDDQLIELEQRAGVTEARTAGREAGSVLAREQSVLRDTRRGLMEASMAEAGQFAPYMRMAARRLELGLSVSRCESIAGTLAGTVADSYALEPMLRAIEALQRQQGERRAMRTDLLRLQGLLVELSRDPKVNQDLVGPIKNATRALANRLRLLRSALDVPYPFDHAARHASLGASVVERVPSDDQTGEVFQAAQQAVSRVLETHLRLLAHLCRLARRVEEIVLPEARADKGAGDVS